MTNLTAGNWGKIKVKRTVEFPKRDCRDLANASTEQDEKIDCEED